MEGGDLCDGACCLCRSKGFCIYHKMPCGKTVLQEIVMAFVSEMQYIRRCLVICWNF